MVVPVDHVGCSGRRVMLGRSATFPFRSIASDMLVCCAGIEVEHMLVTSGQMGVTPSGPSIRYPFEYFAAPLAFASRISERTGLPLWDAVAKYTALQEEVTGAAFQEEPNYGIWNRFLHITAGKAWLDIAQVAYALYLEQPYARFDATWTPTGSTRFGALGVDTSPYNVSRNQVKLHFLPTRSGASDLASSRLSERRGDMKRPLRFVKTTHPSIAYFTSATWLQNLPNYQALFPPAFLQRREVRRDHFLGLWGQFVKWDGSANTSNYDRLLSNLQQAQTLDAIIDSIPLKVLGARVPIEAFYEFYEL